MATVAQKLALEAEQKTDNTNQDNTTPPVVGGGLTPRQQLTGMIVSGLASGILARLKPYDKDQLDPIALVEMACPLVDCVLAEVK